MLDARDRAEAVRAALHYQAVKHAIGAAFDKDVGREADAWAARLMTGDFRRDE